MFIVSACLAGFPCRWDGASKPSSKVVALVRGGEAIPLCPEQLGGLATPREPAEIRGGAVVAKGGAELTEQFKRGAEITLELARRYGCREAILKARSPSCGSGRVYDGGFSGKLVPGDGVAAALLKAEGIAVYTEDDI